MGLIYKGIRVAKIDYTKVRLGTRLILGTVRCTWQMPWSGVRFLDLTCLFLVAGLSSMVLAL
jgi:hypothetical protein